MSNIKNTFLVVFFILVFSPSLISKGLGSFLITRQTFLYDNADGSGKRYYTAKKEAFDVVDISLEKGKGFRYKIVYPYRFYNVSGTGYVIDGLPKSEDETKPQVKVYKRLPKDRSALTSFYSVNHEDINFTGEKKTTLKFPNVLWKEVNFKTRVPLELWATESSGIYRVSKSKEWLNALFEKSKKMKISEEKQKKILFGIIEKGFTKEMVLSSLGEPNQKKEEGEINEWLYSDKKVVFEDGFVKQVF